MQFKIQDLKKLLSSIIKHKVEHLNIKSNDLQITVNKVKKFSYSSSQTKTPHSLNNDSKKQSNINTSLNNDFINRQKTSHENETNNYFTIISPMIGTFYRSPAPNEPAFISINDEVEINQTVCIIEAMKLMNEIQTEVQGKIVEILVKDGDIVDCGQALIRVKHK